MCSEIRKPAFEYKQQMCRSACYIEERWQRSGINTIKYHTWPRIPHGKVTKTQLNITNAGLQIYGGPGSLSHDFKIWPITFQGSGPSGPILFSCEKILLNKNVHLTANLQKIPVGC